MSELKIEYKSLSGLIPYVRNSRTHSDEQVAQIAGSIKEFGWTNPVLVDGDNGIIAGHGRVLAARKLGLETLPVIELKNLTEAQKRAYIIADNKLAENAGWDNELLSLELLDLEAMGYDLSLTGFSDDELDSIRSGSDHQDKEYLTDPDEIPEPPEQYVTSPGEVWVLGPHRLMCGDSTCLEQVQQLMDNQQADLVWTDPPYNVAVKGKAGTIMNDDMATSLFKQFLIDVYHCYYSVMRAGAVIYVAHGESERASFSQCLVDAGLKLSQVLIWVKHSPTLSRQDFNWQHEPILYGWKEGAGHYFCGDFTLRTVIDDSVDVESLNKKELLELTAKLLEATPTTVINHDRPTISELHPTMKPVGLVERMISWSSKDNDVVLDLFGGSGTTLIAAENLNRRARLMELDPRFCDVIIKRWQDYTGEEAFRLHDGVSFNSLI